MIGIHVTMMTEHVDYDDDGSITDYYFFCVQIMIGLGSHDISINHCSSH